MWASAAKCSSRQRGFATLMFTLVILMSLISLTYISASTITNHQRGLVLDKLEAQTFNAAQAGLDYGTPYLTSHYSTVTDGSSVQFTNGDGSTTNVTFAFVGNKDLIRMTSTGSAPNSASSRTVQQLVKYKSDAGGGTLGFALQSQGAVSMKNNAIVSDLSGSTQTIRSGGLVSMSNNAKTILDSGVASLSSPGRDIVMNDLSFAALSDANLFLNFLNAPFTDYQGSNISTTLNFSHSGNYTYYNATNIFSGSIGINQSGGLGQIGNNAKLGKANSPVVLYITLNGNASFQISNNAIIYGRIITSQGSIKLDNNTHLYGDLIVDGNVELGNNVIVDGDVITTGNLLLNNNAQINGVGFALGAVDLSNNAIINGAVLSGGNKVDLSNNARITYNPANAQVAPFGQAGGSNGSYGKVSGSWRELNL